MSFNGEDALLVPKLADAVSHLSEEQVTDAYQQVIFYKRILHQK